ncbi:fatty acyl-CoA synthetase [Williamsia sp. 1138]|uniref:fatty acyl-CoA synthetase n=1 Tax=Williamsia sp. 1138 TaxID=1903117 RepID=UPI001FED9512|nr:fatty acyl-CoA synthetase [Williamsia sp. 1138]
MTPPAHIDQARAHSLGSLPRRAAQRCPGKVAIVDGNVELTYDDFADMVDRTAGAMRESGLAQGDRLALLSRNCWQFAIVAFAAARAGVILVPINFMLRPSEIAFIIDFSSARALIAQDELVTTAVQALSQSAGSVTKRCAIRSSSDAVSLGWEDLQTWIDRDADAPEVSIGDDDPIRMMFTSGTESKPKGALLSSRALMWQYVSCAIDGGMSGDDVELHSLPLYHCAQLDSFLGTDIYLGATNIIVPAPEPVTLLRTIEAHGVTKLFAPPTVWIGLLRTPGFDEYDLSSLRKGYYGASAMPVEILKEIQARLPDVRLWNLYGQTEMAPTATILAPEYQLSHPGAAGRPVLNVETRIHDLDDLPVGSGEVGEVVHRSPQTMLGYFNDEAKTAEAFRGGWFHSGDLGYFDDDGMLYIVDRKKDMIKTGGENVASREVEEAIYLLEGVSEVAVFGVTHPTWVEAVVAVVVPKPGSPLTEMEVIQHTRTLLAGYKTPKRVVIAQELPKNPSGKILKRSLRETYGFDFSEA